MGLRTKPEPAAPACGCAERLAELEAAVAALARVAIRNGHAKDVLDLPGRAQLNPDAAVIRAAATPTAKEQT